MYPPGTGRERLKHFTFPIHVVIADKKASKAAGKKPSMKLSREQEAVAEKIRGLVRVVGMLFVFQWRWMRR